MSKVFILDKDGKEVEVLTTVIIYDGFCRKEWVNNGKTHREDGPAVEYSDGRKEWYINGKLHREDGPALDGFDKEWYINGKLHREDGPAVEYCNGSKEWYVNGYLHKIDGPAVKYANGINEWWYNNEFIGHSGDGFTQENFERYLKIKEYW